MKKKIINILFRLLKIPIATTFVDNTKKKDWLGSQYPLQEFQNYISTRNLHILQILGQGVSKDQEYWMLVGQRIELGRLLTEAKRDFGLAEKKRKKNENAKNKNS